MPHEAQASKHQWKASRDTNKDKINLVFLNYRRTKKENTGKEEV